MGCGVSQGTLRKRRFGNPEWVGGCVGDPEEGEDVKGENIVNWLQRENLNVGGRRKPGPPSARDPGGAGAELRGGAQIGAGPSATSRPATVPCLAPCPPTLSALPGASEQQGKETPRAATAPQDDGKASAPAAPPTDPVTSPEVELSGSAPWPGPQAPTSW